MLCGTAINTFASGSTVMFLAYFTGDKGTSSALKSLSFPSIHIPLIKDIPVIGDIISNHSLITYLGLIAVFLVWVLLFKTPLGLRIRAVGENPNAASSVGVPVRKIRYIAILICGVLVSFGGMFMSMGYLNMFTRDMVAGRGFIALAAAAMGQSSPLGVLLSSGIFALFNGLSNTLQLVSLPPQFIKMLPYIATIICFTVYSIRKKHSRSRLLAA